MGLAWVCAGWRLCGRRCRGPSRPPARPPAQTAAPLQETRNRGGLCFPWFHSHPSPAALLLQQPGILSRLCCGSWKHCHILAHKCPRLPCAPRLGALSLSLLRPPPGRALGQGPPRPESVAKRARAFLLHWARESVFCKYTGPLFPAFSKSSVEKLKCNYWKARC